MALEQQREREPELERELAWEKLPGCSQVATGCDRLRGLGLVQVQQ